MDQLRGLRLFRAVVERGSLAAGAQALDISAPMASKHLARLEARLGVRLMNRSSRQRSLTEAGRRYFEECCAALDRIDAAEAELRQGVAAPSGELKVSLPVWCANAAFARLLAEHRRTFPGVLLDLRLDNRHADLVADGYDLALRATFEPAPSLLARPLGRIDFLPVAAPSLLAGRPLPQRPQELASFGAVVPNYVPLKGLHMNGPAGRESFDLSPCLRTDDSTLALHAVLAGLGLAFLPSPLVLDHIEAARLQHLLPEWRVPAVTLHAVYSSRRQMAPKLRGFIDLLVEQLPRLPGYRPATPERKRDLKVDDRP